MLNNKNTTCVPTIWCDETVPSDLLKTPNHYLELQSDMTWHLCFPELHYESNNERYRMPVEHGQIVEWLSYEDLGFRILTINQDGTYELNEPIPEYANTFYSRDDWEIQGDTLDELVQQIKDNSLDETSEIMIDAAWWSEPYSKRLEIIQGQPVRFVDCAGAS